MQTLETKNEIKHDELLVSLGIADRNISFIEICILTSAFCPNATSIIIHGDNIAFPSYPPQEGEVTCLNAFPLMSECTLTISGRKDKFFLYRSWCQFESNQN